MKELEVDLMFGFGKGSKPIMRAIPQTLVGGYTLRSNDLIEQISAILDQGDQLIIIGIKDQSFISSFENTLTKAILKQKVLSARRFEHPYATGQAAMTIHMDTHEIVSKVGDIAAIQYEGLGNILLIEEVLNRIFTKEIHLHDQFLPGSKEIEENNRLYALPLAEGKFVNLSVLLQAAILNRSPNALLMLANQVIKSNQEAFQIVQEKSEALAIHPQATLNLSGRRINGKEQKLSINDLVKVAKSIFDQPPFLMDLLSVKTVSYEDKTFHVDTNLYHYGKITHGLFFGQQDSMAITLSTIHGEKYITVALGARDLYERDLLISSALSSIEKQTSVGLLEPVQVKEFDHDIKLNIIGDTYFGEFYTERRQRKKREDALMTKGRGFSFEKLRPFLAEGNFNICNFEAAISANKNEFARERKTFVLYSDPGVTGEALYSENIHMATLATNHLLDCQEEGLYQTIEEFESVGIQTIGAGRNVHEAERGVTITVHGQRITFFNAYWFRKGMHREYNFYALDDEAGVACLSGGLEGQIKEEKMKYPSSKVIIIAHWGVDFHEVHPNQRAYAQTFIEAGADIIIGHGPHKIQQVDKIHGKPVIYSIGNGVFNSDGEYNKRFVPPYGFITQLQIEQNAFELRLYPIYTDNLQTYWQPHLVTQEQFNHCTNMLNVYRSTPMQTGVENGNYYYSIPIEM